MASFFNLTLDTLAPAGVTLKINGGALKTGSMGVVLSIGCSDSDKTGYQMKIWGDVDGGLTESAAKWENFATTKDISLTSGDGTKSIKLKVRDSVMNECATVTSTIELDTTKAAVTIVQGPDRDRISEIPGAQICTFAFSANEPFEQFKVCVVNNASDTHDKGTQIPSDYDSSNVQGNSGYAADEEILVRINASDYATALGVGSGGVEKLGIVKVFVFDGVQWSE